MNSNTQLHFISGLPRSGTTLLAAILRQNQQLHSSIQSPLADIVRAATFTMSNSESAFLIDDTQRKLIVESIFKNFYEGHRDKIAVFDNNRSWTAQLCAIATLLPEARVLVCLRNPAWVLDSIERLVQANPLRHSRLFTQEQGSVFGRVESLATKHLLAPALNGVRQAWFSEYAPRLVAIQYDSLVERPRETVAKLYDILGIAPFQHDFDNVEYDEPAFDERLGLVGMHRVSGPVRPRPRETILPPELFSKHDREFWISGANPRCVPVL